MTDPMFNIGMSSVRLKWEVTMRPFLNIGGANISPKTASAGTRLFKAALLRLPKVGGANVPRSQDSSNTHETRESTAGSPPFDPTSSSTSERFEPTEMTPSVEEIPKSALPKKLVTLMVANAETGSFKVPRADPTDRRGEKDLEHNSGVLLTPAVHQQTHPLPARPNLLPSAANAKINAKQQSTTGNSRLIRKNQKTLAGVLRRRAQEKLTARPPRHRDWRAQACSQEEYQAWKRLGQKRLIDAYDWEDNVVVLLQGEEVDGEEPEQGHEFFQSCSKNVQ